MSSYPYLVGVGYPTLSEVKALESHNTLKTYHYFLFYSHLFFPIKYNLSFFLKTIKSMVKLYVRKRMACLLVVNIGFGTPCLLVVD